MKNELKKVKFVQMRSLGSTYQEICEELGVSKPTLIKWSKECECELHNEIEFQKELIRKECGLTYEKIWKIKTQIIDKLMDELLTGDMSSLPKDKLIDLLQIHLNEIPTRIKLKEKAFMASMENDSFWEG